MSLPDHVRLVDVGPRDGLQNEPGNLATEVKVELIHQLAAAGLRSIEATAFVSPRRVPQMADNARVLAAIRRQPQVSYPVLVPNLQGFEAAVEAGAEEVAVFPAATEAFSQRNLNCSMAGSLERVRAVASAAQRQGVRVRGYISCVLGCPYEGAVRPDAVAVLAAQLYELGCYEISLGDTLGVGTPGATQRMLEAVLKRVPAERLAGHYHDTYGMAVANVLISLQAGITVFDASVSGLGGCPFAPGASGNVATEDLVYLLNGMGIATGVDLERLIDAGEFISRALGRPSGSRVARALRARRVAGPQPGPQAGDAGNRHRA